MSKKIVISGGTGFIGKYLTKQFQQAGFQVLVIARTEKSIKWNDTQAIAQALEGADLVINLAGKSVDCRYNQKNREEILNSRIETTKILGAAIQRCERPPVLWINSSTATIYRNATDRPMTEVEGDIGSGFSVDVATNWERAFFDFKLANTRQVALRMAIVLGPEGGVVKPFINLVRFGLGGKQGNGNQMFSWIHIEDLYQIIVFLQSHKTLEGVFNCAAPNPIPNKRLMQTLRQTMGISFGLPSPEWLLKIGAVLINTEVELILKIRWVIPERLVDAGYQFQYPTIESALKAIVK